MNLEDTAQGFVSEVSDVLADYGWYILGLSILLLYIYRTSIQPQVEKYLQKKSEDDYAAKYHKNPDLALERSRAIEEARERMQEEYKRKAEEHEKAEQLRLERKRQEFLEKSSGTGSGQKLGTKTKDDAGPSSSSAKKSSTFRPEYNPLMGAGSSSGYRAPKKSCCGKGCGK